MPRRSPGSAEEDDPDAPTVTNPRSQSLEDRNKKKSFTSAKFDVVRHSETLDRRKVEKAFGTSQLTEGEWSPEAREFGSSEKQKQGHSVIAHRRGSDQTDNMELRDWRLLRLRSPWRTSLLTLITTLVSALLLTTIVRSFLGRQLDPKGCKMCYMFQGYAKLSDFDTEHTRFASKYSLYLYRELNIEEDTMLKGAPVLFITGNAGSYRQVRPLAAEAAYYFADHLQQNTEALHSGTRGLDFFTADFNEDITAFHGQTLLDQAEYLNEAIAYILSLYQDPRRSRRDPGLPDPTSVIIVGHSMGGIVARTMLVMPNYQSNSINTIITMSTPHARAPVSFDADIVSTYAKINDYWREAYSQKWANDNPLWHVTLISIAGGGLDTIVPSDYASLSSLVPETHGFTVFTSSVPNVWTGSDHLSILWCDQFRKVIIRSILDAVDVRRPGQTKSRAERMRIFKKWYLTGMESIAEKELPEKGPTTLLTLEDNSNSILAAGKTLVIRELGHHGKPKAYLLPVPPISPQAIAGEKRFTLLTDQRLDATSGTGNLDVLFCSVFPLHPGQSSTLFAMNMDLSGATSGSTRLACKNAASDTILLPASKSTSKYPFDDSEPFSYLQYNLEDIIDHQFVAVIDKSASLTKGWVMAEFSDNAHFQIQPQVGLGQLLASGLSVTLPASRPMNIEVRVPAVHSSMLVYKLSLGPQGCGDNAGLFTPLVRQYISEPFESKYFVNVKEADINLHGVAPYMPPALKADSMMDGLNLQLWSDMTCSSSIDLSLKVDIGGSLGKLYMRYRTVFPAIPLVIIALVLRKQFMIHDHTSIFITFAEALDMCLRSSLPVLLSAMTIFSITLANSSTHPSGGPLNWGGNATETAAKYTKNDLLLGSQDPFFWFLIPLFGLIGVGVCVLLNYAALLVTRILYAFYSIVTLAPVWIRAVDRRRTQTPLFTSASPRRRIMITSILLLMVSSIIPYQFAYMVACIVQLVTCTRALRAAVENRSPANHYFYNYAHSILVLMLWVLPINIPILVVWIHNLAVHWLTPFSSHHNVLSIMPFIVLVETLTGGTMIPRVTSSSRHITNILFFFLAVYAALYGVTYAYRLHHLANLICAWLVAVHLSTSSFSLRRLNQMLEGGDGGVVGGGAGAGGGAGSSGFAAFSSSVGEDFKKRP